MTTSSTSYLQTLAKDEAIAFVASLQKVKDYLSQEIQWLSEQVQQKTAQLQGIEAILSEAEALGTVATETHLLSENAVAGVTPVASLNVTGVTPESGVELPATEKGSPSSSETEPAAIAALSVQKPSTSLRGQQGKATSAKISRNSKPLETIKPSTAKEKQANPSPPPVKASQRVKASGLQRFLKRSFRDQALTKAVSDILNHAAAPMSTDEVMAELYDGLPKADYDRAKHSLANILSVGRSKGVWKSAGRGLYAAHAVTTV